MYKKIIRPLLFKFSPESIHHFIFFALDTFGDIPGISRLAKKTYAVKHQKLEREVFGIKFPNPVGLAAGLDKNADAFDMLGNLGFGFVEIGTVTPQPQAGNPKPRVFRLKKNKALINRMGFNNEGVEQIARRLKKRKTNVIIGGNIGKNKLTLNSKAVEDYEICFETLFKVVDYFVVNVSSPNTPNLRELQDKEPLTQLLNRLQELNLAKKNPKPILLKVAPDLTNEQIDDIIEIVQTTKIAGIVATNTTIARKNLEYTHNEIKQFGAGGLSGSPLTQRSTEIIRYIVEKSDDKIPVIGVGGIMTPEDALEKLEAGAKLVQLYTGFIYEGPDLVRKINDTLIEQNQK